MTPPPLPAAPRAEMLGSRTSTTTGNRMLAHHFTVDVEEYFHVSAFEPVISPSRWATMESAIAPQMELLLSLLAEHDAHGTFFVLGWLAERRPEIVRAIASAGHEIASHGWDHKRVTLQSPDQFRTSIRRAKELLEDQTGTAVLGFRAPSFSIVPGREWALDLLVEEGHRYDSSLFPIRRSGYGYPGADPDPHLLLRPAGPLIEVPPTTLRVGNVRLPAAGGAYFRILPYALTRGAFHQSAARGVPGTFYIHPWEVDPEQPRIEVPLKTRIRHYGGLKGVEGRLRRLLSEFRFTSIAKTLAASPTPAVARAPLAAALS